MADSALAAGQLPENYVTMRCDECGATELEMNGDQINWHCSVCGFNVCSQCKGSANAKSVELGVSDLNV